MVELFSGMPPGHEFFERFSFIKQDELPEVKAVGSGGWRTRAWMGSGEGRSRHAARAALQDDSGSPPPRPDG
jgi:hypothetical protein